MKLNDAFLTYKKLVLTTPKQLSTECGRWEHHIAPVLGAYGLHQIKNLQIVQLRNSLNSKNLSPQTVHHCLSLLRRVMRRAVEWELYPGPVPVFRMPKFDNRRLRFLSPKEASLLLNDLKIRSELWHDVVLFALYTGMRAGEIYALKSYHVDFEHQIVMAVDTKNGLNRTIPLNSSALAVAKKYYQDRKEGPGFGEASTKYYIFHEAVKACGFNKGVRDRREMVCFHTLRHTFASWLVQNGTPLIIVSRLLGHKDMRMTMRYAHLAPDQGVKAVSLLPCLN